MRLSPKPKIFQLKQIFRSPITTSILICIIFLTIYAKFTLYRHLTFNSHAFDLGIYTQASYLYSLGEIGFSTLKDMVLLGDHFGVILILLSPIYKLFPSASTLLVLQALFVSVSSVPLFLIAYDKLKSKLLSALITVSYLTSIGIISAVGFDFHLATISVLPLSLILYSWYFRRWRLYWFSIFLSILFKEDIPLFIIGLGLFEIFQRQFRVGAATFVFGILSYVFIKQILMPLIWPGSQDAYLATSILPLNNPVEAMLLLLFNPKLVVDIVFNSDIKLATMNSVLQPFGYLSLFSPLTYLTVFPNLFLRFSSDYSQMWTTLYHHNANIMPFMFLSAVLGISKFRIPHNAVAVLLIFFLLTEGLRPNGVVATTFYSNSNISPIWNNSRKQLDLIPGDAAVSAQSPLVPHLANRRKIYLYPKVEDASYIVLNMDVSTYPLEKVEMLEKIETLKRNNQWQLYQYDNLLVFKKIIPLRSGMIRSP